MAFEYSTSLLLTSSAVSLTQQAIAKAIIRSSEYERIACGRPLLQTNVLSSSATLVEYSVISLLRTNSSNFAITSGRVFEDVVNPGTEFGKLTA